MVRLGAIGVVGLALLLHGCSGAGEAPEASQEEVIQKTMESGMDAMMPGVDSDVAKQAMEQFQQTGRIDPSLRKRLEQQASQSYGGQYPGAQRRPPQQ